MTDMARTELLINHRNVIKCETTDEAELFIGWCIKNSAAAIFEMDTYLRNFSIRTGRCYRCDEGGYLSFSSEQFYLKNGYNIISFQDFFADDHTADEPESQGGIEQTNLNRIISCYEENDSITEKQLCKLLYCFEYGKKCTNCTCTECQFRTNLDCFRYLAKRRYEPIRVTQNEYNILDCLRKANPIHKNTTFDDFILFSRMKENGEFRNIEGSMNFSETFSRLEVEP